MRIARIARPDALYDASVSAQTCDTIDETIIYPIDIDEIDDLDLAKDLGANSHPRIPGFGGFSRNSPKSANMVDSLKKMQRSANRVPVLRFGVYCICRNRLRN